MLATSPSVAFAGAVALVLASTTAVAVADASGVSTSAAPTRAERQEFESLRDAAERAGEAGEWDRFLDHAESALDALPESDGTHGERAEVMDLVGDWELDGRGEPQLRRSLAILESYAETLRKKYGDGAERRPGWTPAHRYIEELRRRLPERDNPPAAAAVIPAAPAPAVPAASPARARTTDGSRRDVAIIGTGGALTGVGAVLLVVGLALTKRWANQADEYDVFVAPCRGTPACAGEQGAWDEFTSARATSLGLGISGALLTGVGIGLTVVGVRRRHKRPDRGVSVAADGFGMRIEF